MSGQKKSYLGNLLVLREIWGFGNFWKLCKMLYFEEAGRIEALGEEWVVSKFEKPAVEVRPNCLASVIL